MRVNRILSSLLCAPLLIYRGTAESMLPVLDQLLLGKPVGGFWDEDDEEEESPLSLFAFEGGKMKTYASFDEAPVGSVAVINLKGVMMREDNCGTPGTETLAKLFQEAYEHPNVSGIVHKINSGGGTVDGTEAFASVVGAGTKPVVSFVQNMMASAGAWVGLQAKYVMLEGKTSMVGSIGTQISLSSRAEYYQKLGIKDHLIRATESVDKNEVYQQALQGNYEPIREEMLDPLNSVFLESVQASRAGKLKGKTALTGKMFVGDAAIKQGLADGYGSLQDAVNKAIELAEANVPKTGVSAQSFAKTTTKPHMKHPLLMAVLGMSAAFESTSEGIHLQESHLDALEASLAAQKQLQEDKTKAEQALSAKDKELTAKGEELTQITEERDALQVKVSEYGSQPGATPTNPAAKGNELEGEPTTPKVELDPEAAAYHSFSKFLN